MATGMLTTLGAWGCGASLTPSSPPVTPAPIPAAEAPRPVPSPPVPARGATPPSGRLLVLPSRITPTVWRVQRRTTVAMDGAPERPTLEEEARVTLQWERGAGGTLRGRGSVESYRLSGGDAEPRTVPSLAVQVTVDSAAIRVVPEPPLVNACDREEMTAARLAGAVAMRLPDGVTVGSVWRERLEGTECRAGVVIRVVREVTATLSRWDGEEVTVTREGVVRLEGRGGRPFELVELEGEGRERDELVLSARLGVVLRAQGRGTVAVRVWEGTDRRAARRMEQVTEWSAIAP